MWENQNIKILKKGIKMKIKRKVENGITRITVEKQFFFGLYKKTTTYRSSSSGFGTSFLIWLKEPNYLIVDDYTSFQLNEWNNIMRADEKLKEE